MGSDPVKDHLKYLSRAKNKKEIDAEGDRKKKLDVEAALSDSGIQKKKKKA